MNWFTEKVMGLFGKKTEAESTVEAPAPAIDYSSMKVPELKAIAKERGVKGYYKLKKADLISTLRDEP